MPAPYFSNNNSQISQIIRVNHAGEYGAKRIYQGQLKYAIHPKHRALIEEMLNQEEKHLGYFEQELLDSIIRPTALLFFWHHLGYLLGAMSQVLGNKTAMLVTQNVEEVIEKHYQSQINYLKNTNTNRALLEKITLFQSEEIAHKNIAITHDSKEAFFAPIIGKVVKLICLGAITLSKNI